MNSIFITQSVHLQNVLINFQIGDFDSKWRKLYPHLDIEKPVSILSFRSSNKDHEAKVEQYIRQVLPINCLRATLLRFLGVDKEVICLFLRGNGEIAIQDCLYFGEVFLLRSIMPIPTSDNLTSSFPTIVRALLVLSAYGRSALKRTVLPRYL